MRADLDLVAFDLDGTLVDSAPDLHHCLGIALAAVSRPAPSIAATRSLIGGGIEQLVARALEQSGESSQRAYPAALAQFHECYRDHLFTASRLYVGVTETLARLDRAGLTLACVTNKREAYATRLLELAGVSRHFAFVFGGDRFLEKKPHPRPLLEAALRAATQPARCALVGDSAEDCRSAAAAGFRFVWAAYGYGASLAQVAEAGSYARIDRCEDLIAALGLPC